MEFFKLASVRKPGASGRGRVCSISGMERVGHDETKANQAFGLWPDTDCTRWLFCRKLVQQAGICHLMLGKKPLHPNTRTD